MSEALHCTSTNDHTYTHYSRPMSVDGAIQTLRVCCEPCGNEDCDVCYPIPRWKISTERVQRLFYEREIKAATEAEALAIYNEGTAWPTQYDDRYGEILERHAPVITREPPESDDWSCYHKLNVKEFAAKAGDADEDAQ